VECRSFSYSPFSTPVLHLKSIYDEKGERGEAIWIPARFNQVILIFH